MARAFVPAAVILLAAALLASATGRVADAQSLPAGAPLLGVDPLAGLARYLPSDGRVVSQVVPVEGQSFPQAIRVQTRSQPAQPWDIQLTLSTSQPVLKGDMLLFTFFVRSLATTAQDQAAKVEFNFERAGPPWEKSAAYLAQVSADGAWKRFDVPFASGETYAAGQAHITLRLGYEPQTVEIGAVQLLNYGKRVSLVDLPRTPVTYAGREPDAAWRKAAQERIERIRKADLRVVVVDGSGKPISGASVAVRMRKHTFAFGSAVSVPALLDPSQTRYRDEIARLFNTAVIENALKWPNWEGGGRGSAPVAIDWLREKGIAVRGHNLVWPSWQWLPGRLRNLAGDREALARNVLDHIAEEAGALNGRLIAWDVINEPYTNHDLMDLLGNGAMIEWFKAARAADPHAQLFINDYDILAGVDKSHRDAYEKTIRFLLEGGAPVDAIGMQGHFGASNATPPEMLLKILDRFAAFGKPIWVTEFDHAVNDEALQADYLRDFYAVLFSHPAVEGILMWGFWDARHWKQNAPLFRRDWSLKPSGQAWMDLVFKEWWTDVKGETDVQGAYATRGFLGEYEIEVRAGDRVQRSAALLPQGGATVRVVVGP